MVDLAGSEKVNKTGAKGNTLEEAKMINKSLSCLGNVINSLTDGKSSHIPYRNSMLTRMLQDSIGGNSKTTLIITCSPAGANLQESLGTLRFGARAKKIKNVAKINREMTKAELEKLVAKLRAEIEKKDARILGLEMFIKELGAKIPSLKDLPEYQEEVEGDEEMEEQNNEAIITSKDDEDPQNKTESVISGGAESIKVNASTLL